MPLLRLWVLILTLVMSGRVMTLAFIHRAGGANAGDPPIHWLMPLIGDAVVGLTGLVVALLLWRRPVAASWIIALCWNVVAIWDALSAYIVSRTSPWPEFFMLQVMGPAMFFIASAMHLLIIWLLLRPALRPDFGQEAMRE